MIRFGEMELLVVAVMFLACAVTVHCEDNFGKNDPQLFATAEQMAENTARWEREHEEKTKKNLGKDCWKPCTRSAFGNTYDCHGFCGANAYCCRKGYKIGYRKADHACEKTGGGCKNYHCCIEKVPTARNVGKQCWYKCKKKGGECPQFCGSGALCCRKGWKNQAGCTGGCKDKHCCTKK